MALIQEVDVSVEVAAASAPEPEPEQSLSDGPGPKMIKELDEAPETFSFHLIDDAPSVTESDDDLADKFIQWGFTGEQGSMQRHVFRYDQYYQKYMSDQLIKDLFNSDEVRKVFQVPVKEKGNPNATAPLGTVTKVRTQEIACGQTSLTVFDRLGAAGIVREGGSIQKCFDNYIDDLQLADELGNALVDEESEHYTLFDDDDRDEFLFRVFRHCCIGGGMCQFEDAIAPYLDATKKIYKDMLAVRKNDETGKIEIVSQVFDIRAVKCQEKTAPSLFLTKSPYSFCYVVLNPVKRQVVLWYMPWRTMFG